MERRRKAAPLPIFSKRPKQALFAHPNNVYQSSELHSGDVDIASSSYYAPKMNIAQYGGLTERQENRLDKEGLQPSTCKTQFNFSVGSKGWSGSYSGCTQQENRPPYPCLMPNAEQPDNRMQFSYQPHSLGASTPARSKDPASFHNAAIPAPCLALQGGHPGGPKKVLSANQTTHSRWPLQQQSASTDGTTRGPDGTARGPDGTTRGPDGTTRGPDGTTRGPDGTTRGPDGATRGPQIQIKSQRLEVRVLTATAQSMQHWSKFGHVSCLLFEVFGSLNSAVTAESSNAKQFVLKTSDGIIRCIFWEMDRSLPQLVRGHPIRVVGNWDSDKAFLKCYSVRPVHSNEDNFILPAVAASDKIMRYITASVAEV